MIRAIVATMTLALALSSTSAQAFPWMINHDYTHCASCHVDPSGGGQITAYGRAIFDQVVRWHWDEADLQKDEPSPSAGFLFGIVELPEWLELSANLRAGALMAVGGIGTEETRLATMPIVPDGPESPVIPLRMASEARAAVMLERFIAHASIGMSARGAGAAAIASRDGSDQNVIVSREHWLALKMLDDALWLRAGRMALPFGLRNPEHNSFVRSSTRTDINAQQQHGASVHFASETVRAELMGIAGNYQLRPDEYRERGYAGLVEVTPLSGLAVGASSLVTYAKNDLDTQQERLRQAHGVFSRYGPLPSLAAIAEADLLVDVGPGGKRTLGGVGFGQLDWQPIQGVHLLPTLEARRRDDAGSASWDLGAWGSAIWYVAPHTELRADVVYREAIPATGAAAGALAAFAQFHLYL